MVEKEGRRIQVRGVVQGVGFRPFVYGLATAFHLTGWVRNSSAGVDIEVDGSREALDEFIEALSQRAPSLAQIDDLEVEKRPPNGFDRFEIVASKGQPADFQPISPDVTICPDCLHELLDPHDRRYRYPFINCTNCGPRFTIIRDIPYDRPLTTMADFALCPACLAEYEDPANRRFHAQPVACPDCGPQIWLEMTGSESPGESVAEREAALNHAQRLLAQGHILAVKGLGGFHLACKATNPTAVTELRRRKLRREKPFAVMMPDLDTVRQHCRLSPAEVDLLTSPARPIVILDRLPSSTIAEAVAPRQATLGVMLPYTPLHYLLFASLAGQADADPAQKQVQKMDGLVSEALVMTSGNLSEEPIAYTNEAARRRLAPLADALLLHDRPIHVRCDDSVMRVTPAGARLPLRRSRGYAPFPVRLPWPAPPILGAGAELKNTFCLSHGRYAFLSHHVGDLENVETLTSFAEGVAHFERLFRVTPTVIAYDRHPNYLATRAVLARAAREGLKAVGVQHHHAHLAAVMAEHGLDGERPLLGAIFDGTGYGEDGTIWGGEFLVADYAGYERPFYLKPLPLPGGDMATKEPWRIALAYLHQAGLAWEEDLPPVAYARQHGPLGDQTLPALSHQLTTGLHVPLTSSLGRLFDAVAALLGLRAVINYEAQAAIELEALAAQEPAEDGRYPVDFAGTQVDPSALLAGVVSDMRQGTAPAKIAARFHNAIAWLTAEVCQKMRRHYSLAEVALSGGVWQNVTLLAKTLPLLASAGLTVYQHEQVPPNDGGLALGQVAVAAYRQRNGR